MFTEFHEAFFGKFLNLLIEWVQQLKDNNLTYRHDEPRSWRLEEVCQLQEVSNKTSHDIEFWFKSVFVMKPTHKKIENKYQCLRNWPLRGGNLLYITQVNNSWMIQMTKPPFYI